MISLLGILSLEHYGKMEMVPLNKSSDDLRLFTFDVRRQLNRVLKSRGSWEDRRNQRGDAFLRTQPKKALFKIR